MPKPLTWTNVKAKLSQLNEWEKNPVKIDAKSLADLALSMKKYPGVLPYVAAGPKGKGLYPLLDGHQRKWAEIEINKVAPDMLVDLRVPSRALTDAERSEIVIRLRKNVGVFDDALLLANFADFPLLEWGFKDRELLDIGFDAPEVVDAEPQIDRAGELLKKWKVKTGDLWQIGEHRLLCGDSTKREDVGEVMGGEKAQICFTSPPYAEQRKEQYGGIPVEKYIEWWNGVQECTKFILLENGSFFVNIKPHCEDGQRVLYVFDLILAMVRNWHWLFIDEFSWIKGSFPGGFDNRFKNGFEPIYHFSVSNNILFNPYATAEKEKKSVIEKEKKKTPSGFMATTFSGKDNLARPDNVIDIHANTGNNLDHAATFPVELSIFFIKSFTNENDVVYEPFNGSGTTLVACQNLGRRGRGIEISPAYCAVTLQRMSDAFPGIEIKLLDSTSLRKPKRV